MVNTAKGRTTYILLLLCVFISFLYQLPKNAFSDEIEISIKGEKRVYHVGEFNRLEGSLKNISHDPIWLNTRFSFPGPEIYLIIKNSSGKVFQWLPSEVMTALSRDKFTLLPPGENISFIIDDIQIHLSMPMSPDAYSVQAVYKNNNGPEFGIDAWQGEAISNFFEFIVVEDNNRK